MTHKTPFLLIQIIDMVYDIERDSNGELNKEELFRQKIKLSDYKIKESIRFVHIYIDLF